MKLSDTNLISRDEYDKALSIVEEYHKQLKDKIDYIDSANKHDIHDFIGYCGDKLPPVIHTNIVLYKIRNECKYVEDIDINKFKEMRGNGIKAVSMVDNLIKKYLDGR